MLDRFLGFFFA